eukprot:6482985-Amphidinium_carterae.2
MRRANNSLTTTLFTPLRPPCTKSTMPHGVHGLPSRALIRAIQNFVALLTHESAFHEQTYAV